MFYGRNDLHILIFIQDNIELFAFIDLDFGVQFAKFFLRTLDC